MSILKAGTRSAAIATGIIANWPIFLGALVLLIVLALVGAFVYRVANPAPKRADTTKAVEAVRSGDANKMREVLAENDVIEAGIDNSIKAAEVKTAEGIQKRQGRSNAELAAEIEEKFGVNAQ